MRRLPVPVQDSFVLLPVVSAVIETVGGRVAGLVANSVAPPSTIEYEARSAGAGTMKVRGSSVVSPCVPTKVASNG